MFDALENGRESRSSSFSTRDRNIESMTRLVIDADDPAGKCVCVCVFFLSISQPRRIVSAVPLSLSFSRSIARFVGHRARTSLERTEKTLGKVGH